MGDTIQEPRPKSKFEKVVTNEATLFSYRLVTTLGVIYAGVALTQIMTGTADLRRDFGDFKERYAAQVAGTIGQVELLKDRVNAQSDRITGVQTDLREIWHNIRDLLARK